MSAGYKNMDQSAYENWWGLHLRLARGGALTAEEQGVYDAGRATLEREERFQEAADAKRVRDELTRLEREHGQLENRRRQLEAEISELETRLSEPTRQMLTIAD